MLKNPGMGMVEVGLLSAVPYLAAVIAEISIASGRIRTGKRLPLVWPSLALAALAFYGSYLLGGTNFWASFVLLVLAGAMMYGALWALLRLISPKRCPPMSSGGAIALINSMGALGSFVGAYGVGS